MPSTTPFVELRGSALLDAPLRVSGEYRRPAADVLVRVVHAPHPESTTLRDGTIELERNGKVRRFALSRAPELAGLQASFGALLSGDRTALSEHYAITSTGTRNHWKLTLTPKGEELAQQVRDIVLYGRGAELRCIETRTPADAQPQRTLLASAARAAGQADDAAAFAGLCHGDDSR